MQGDLGHALIVKGQGSLSGLKMIGTLDASGSHRAIVVVPSSPSNVVARFLPDKSNGPARSEALL